MSASQEKIRYKLQHLKVYCSTENLFHQKKFRRTFVDKEVGYLYGELALYNIFFDEKDWEATIEIKGFSVNGKKEKELFSMKEKVDATKDQNIIYVRKGWGTEKRMYWKYGKYCWKAYIDKKLVATSYFYIEKEGLVTGDNNPYFDIGSIRLFEAPDATPNKEKRTYCTQFDTNEARYIYVQLELANKLNYNWQCEIEFHYYNQHGQLKGYFRELITMSKKIHETCSGWGSLSKKSWARGTYTCEVLFMGQLIAVVPFIMGESNIEGVPELLSDNLVKPQENNTINEKTLDDLLKDLDSLTGLQSIKTQLREYISYLNFERIRKEKGLSHNVTINLHTIFMGNPGTGKTTVAKKMGEIYKAMGLLTKGHVHEVDRSDLVAQYIGQTAPLVKKAIEKARGGVLFIDEAYALTRDGESKVDFGREVIEILLKEMSDGKGNLAVIAAGYPKEMNTFINSNPGLKSRFGNYYNFPDYLPEELMEIATNANKNKGLILMEDARVYLEEKVTHAYRDRDHSFGNARYVLSLVNGAKMNMALRLVDNPNTEEMSDDELSTILLEDVQALFLSSKSKQLSLSIDENRLKDALNELESYIGMDTIKQEIRDIVKLVRYYNDIGKDVLNQFVLHTVFTGNPGTGKTSIARIFAKIFNALGVLEKGHLVECDRSQLVGEYLGQTAPKTLGKIEEAIGGVLFIDEAYSLTEGEKDSFGKEAISTLLKQMEDRSKEFILIVAGYPNNMDVFLESNPGLKSRFDQSLLFEDYTEGELFKIGELMLRNEELHLTDEAKPILKKYLQELYEERDEFFGNAREVRKLVQNMVQTHHLRMADLEKSKRTIQMITAITSEDLQKLPAIQQGGRASIGFRKG